MLVKVDSLDHDGRGICRVDNKVTFVSGVLPGEIVDIIITKEKKSFNLGKVLKILEISDSRVKALCPYYNECGGCEIMHMSYETQLDFKKNKVVDILKRYTNVIIDPIIYKSDKSFNYRNKITLHNKNGNLGYMGKGSNSVISINECMIADEAINRFIRTINNYEGENLVIRVNQNGEIISTLNNDFLLISVNNFVFRVDAFFQVNSYICSCIFNFISDNLECSDVCLDLYSGVGTLSILASKKVSRVYAIEVNSYSYNNALENMKLNNVNNVEFILGDVSKKINFIDDNIDVIITDPPRSGMDHVTIETILKFKPRKVIYVSCNPMTLARDLNILLSDYIIEKSAIFDMFPNTSHVECVCVMKKIIF